MIPGTVTVTAPLAPPSPNSPFGTVLPIYSTGGALTGVTSLAQLQNQEIYPLERRHSGQLGILTDKRIFQLEPDLTTWTLKSLGGEIAIPNILPVGDGLSEAGILLRGAAGTSRHIDFYSGLNTPDKLRWRQQVNGIPENGLNQGSDWVLTRYSDVGTAIYDAITISRETGTMTVTGFVEAPNFFGTFTGNLVGDVFGDITGNVDGNITGTSAQALKLAVPRTLGITGDLTWTSPAFDGSVAVSAVGTLASVNSNTGTYGSASLVPVITVNAKGLITSVNTVTVAGASPPSLFPVGDGIGTAGILIQGGASTMRVVDFYSGTASAANLRWRLQVDSFSEFKLSAYTDTGTFFADTLTVARQTGNVTVGANLEAGGFLGPLTGSVIGDVIGNVSGNLTGDVQGDVTGNVSGNAATANVLVTGRTISITGDLGYTSGLFTGAGNVTGIGTLATVNSNPGTFGSPTLIPVLVVDAKGRITSITTVTVEGGGTGGGGGGGTVPEGGTGQTTLGLNGVLIGQGINPVLVSNPGVIGQVFTSNGPGAPPSFQALTATLADEAIKLQTPRTIGMTGDITWTSGGFDGTAAVTGAGVLATVNAGPGAFGSGTLIPIVTVNAKGLVTLVSTVAVGNAASATVLQTGRTIGMTGDLVWTSPAFNGSAAVTAAGVLATVNSNVGAFGSGSTIPILTVNAKGLVTAVSTATVIMTNAPTATALQTARTIGMTGGDITWSSPAFDGTANVSSPGILNTVNSNVGSFGSATLIPTFTVDGKGRLTAAGTVALGNAPTATALLNSLTPIGDGATDAGFQIFGPHGSSRRLDFHTGAVSATSLRWRFSIIDVESAGDAGGNLYILRATDAGVPQPCVMISRASGAVTFSGSISAAGGFNGSVTGAATSLVPGATIGITGDLVWTSPVFTGAGNITAAGVLATVNANVGSFGSATLIPTFTVDGKGRLTAAGTVALGNAATATALQTGRTISITGDLTYTSGAFDGTAAVTGTGTLASVNANVGSFGSATLIPTFTVNAKGLITAAGTVALGNAPTATALATGRTISITGDLTYTSASFTGAANVTGAGTLATVNSNVGSFGSSTLIPVITVNAKGLVTAISTVTAAGGGGGGGSLIVPFGFTTGDKVNVVPNGKVVGYSTYRQAGTITGWSIAADAGAVSVYVWKKATGTTVPTAADEITSTGFELTTGTYIRSSNVSNLSTTAVASGDIFAWEIFSDTAKEVSFGLEITPT